MAVDYPMVPLSEVLTLYQDYIEEPEPRIYPKLSVKLYGRGVVLDESADGSLLKMKRHQIAKSGQVILSEIWGKKGAIGFVPPEGDGALCTSHFFLFDLSLDRIDPKYLQATFTANYLQDQLDTQAQGTTGYAAVRPKHLLATVIPLPPLDEQRRIVARIDALAARIEEARGLRREAGEEAEVLFKSELAHVFALDGASNLIERLEDITERIADINHVMPEAVDEGIKFISPKDFTEYDIDFLHCKKISQDDFDVLRERIQPRKGDILFARYGTVAEARLVDVDDVFLASYSIVTIRPNASKCDSKYLLYALQAPTTIAQAYKGIRAIAVPDLGIKTIRGFHIPIPTLDEQHRIVIDLDGLHSQIRHLKQLQAETDTELEALLPAVLDQAFRGEL